MWAERRRTLKNNLPSTLTKEQWEQTKAAFNNKCAYCGSGGKLTQEHIVPVSDGGGYTAENIIPACARCNFSKKQKPFELWYPSQAFYSVEREAAILRVVGGYAVQSSEST
jgi:5-methylcytosine-specific restriction endonuclease McrA